MRILAAIKREEDRVEKQLAKLQHRLSSLRSAAKALGHSAERGTSVVRKRVMSAAASDNWEKLPKSDSQNQGTGQEGSSIIKSLYSPCGADANSSRHFVVHGLRLERLLLSARHEALRLPRFLR
jgi:hypothetical protein